MDSDEAYRIWAADAALLSEIGRALGQQPVEITVRLPKALADRALASWQRDVVDVPLPDAETPAQRTTRHRAGTTGLIGLSVEQNGIAEGDEVSVRLDAWFIGNALEAADDDGVLDR